MPLVVFLRRRYRSFMDQSQLPPYLVEALQRFAKECRAEALALARSELRGQMASLLGLPMQERGDTVTPPEEFLEPEEERPTLAYGAIGRVVREIMTEAPRQGLLIGDIVSRARHDKGLDITARMAREALKRLKKSEDVECRNRSRWVATDKLRGAKDANENGAPNGYAASAPIASEGWKPSLFRQEALGRPS